MIDIDKHSSIIEKFIKASIEKFKIETNENPQSIGIYCCPWAGWLTTNFNINKTLDETGNNCPDFEFVEFDFLELNGWQSEYETDSPTYKINCSIISINHESSDEKLNELIFGYIGLIVSKLKTTDRPDILIQMLDSKFVTIL